MGYIFQQSVFVIRIRYFSKIVGSLRKLWFSLLGMKIGKNTTLSRIYTTWPNQVSIGDNCKIEHGVFFKFDGVWSKGPSIFINNNVFIGANCEFNIRVQIDVGNDSLIASGCKFIDHDHGTLKNELMRKQQGPEKAITVGDNVWLGCNVIILKGVQIGNGAIVAAGAVVTASVPAGEIWGGVPAKKIGETAWAQS